MDHQCFGGVILQMQRIKLITEFWLKIYVVTHQHDQRHVLHLMCWIVLQIHKTKSAVYIITHHCNGTPRGRKQTTCITSVVNIQFNYDLATHDAKVVAAMMLT